MISIISGTNRKNSKTLIVAKAIVKAANDLNVPNQLIDLNQVDFSIKNDDSYTPTNIPQQLLDIQNQYILPVDKLVIVSPEYNGSFPGILKYFLDLISVKDTKETFFRKKFALFGVASGRAGNLRGMDHLTGILNHLGAVVMPGSLPISGIGKLTTEDNQLNQDIQDLIKSQLKKLIEF